MGTRTGSHQLSSGLIVSGRPEQPPKDRPPAVASRTVIYTGGDVKKSGDLGKMYGLDVSSGEHANANPPPGLPKLPSRPPSGSARSGQSSGTLGWKSTNSGPISKKSSSSSFSGPITPTGLITSGPLPPSGPLSGSNRRSGQLDASSALSSFNKSVYGAAVTSLTEEVKLGLRVSRVAMWVFLVVAVMGLVVGGFLMAAVKKAVILVAVVAVLSLAVVLVVWNYAYRKRGVLRWLRKFPVAELRGAVDGQYVKVTGVVTCGSIPLETSFQKVPRCVYVSSELYEYSGCGGRPANDKLNFFSRGCRYSERYVADFYISDFQTGLRALVKAGYGAKVAPFVKPTAVINLTKDNKESSSSFLRWLSDRGLSSDDRVMRLKEGCIKEGDTVSVIGMVQRHENVLMIVPPTEPVSTGFQWLTCLLPSYIQGLIVMCDDTPNGDVIPV